MLSARKNKNNRFWERVFYRGFFGGYYARCRRNNSGQRMCAPDSNFVMVPEVPRWSPGVPAACTDIAAHLS